jgi:hypothetical protein
MSGVGDVFGWLGTSFHAVLALAFIVVCFVKGKAVGMGGAALLAVLAVLDVLGVCVWRVGFLVLRSSHAGYSSMDSFFTGMQVVNTFSNAIGIGLAVAAFALLRRGPSPR